MHAHSSRTRDGVKDFVLVTAVGFADEAFDAVAVNGVLEVTFGYAYNYLIYRFFICNRDKIVKTLEWERGNLLSFVEKLFYFDF